VPLDLMIQLIILIKRNKKLKISEARILRKKIPMSHLNDAVSNVWN